jgi:hypothetical protein
MNQVGSSGEGREKSKVKLLLNSSPITGRWSLVTDNWSLIKIKCRRWIAMVLVILATMSLSACSLDNFKTQAAQVPQIVFSILSDPKKFNA